MNNNNNKNITISINLYEYTMYSNGYHYTVSNLQKSHFTFMKKGVSPSIFLYFFFHNLQYIGYYFHRYVVQENA